MSEFPQVLTTNSIREQVVKIAEECGEALLEADGPRYKALGNSMAVPVMRWIGERINHSIVRDEREKAR